MDAHGLHLQCIPEAGGAVLEGEVFEALFDAFDKRTKEVSGRMSAIAEKTGVENDLDIPFLNF